MATVLLAAMAIGVLAQKRIDTRPESEIDREHAEWVDRVMQEIATVKPGMKRSDILRVFTEEGGLSTRSHRTYVYRHCPYIKVEVEFSPLDHTPDESLEDKVTKISRPFLEYSVMD